MSFTHSEKAPKGDQELIFKMVNKMTKNISLSGSLKFVCLADVFQILGSNASTGILKLKTPHAPHEGVIHFLKGNPVNASYGTVSGLKAIYLLFGWMDGDYTFSEEEVSSSNQTIKKSRMEIVLDALRMLDDGEIKKVGSPSIDLGETKDKKADKEREDMPAIKGPFNDYLHVVREDFFKDGEDIVKEGSHGKWIWTIYEGLVKVTKMTENGSLLLARLGEGCLIGTIRALLFGDYERNATVTAEGDVRLCLLDAEPYYHEYAALSREFRRLLISLDTRLRRLNERAIDIYFKRDKAKEQVRTGVKMRDFKPDTELYTIVEGNASIITRGPKGDLPILSLEQNDVFGNIPFMDIGHEPRSAIVLPSKDLKVEKLDIKDLEEEYNKLSPTFRNMIFNIGSYITMTTHLVHQYNQRN